MADLSLVPTPDVLYNVPHRVLPDVIQYSFRPYNHVESIPAKILETLPETFILRAFLKNHRFHGANDSRDIKELNIRKTIGTAIFDFIKRGKPIPDSPPDDTFSTWEWDEALDLLDVRPNQFYIDKMARANLTRHFEQLLDELQKDPQSMNIKKFHQTYVTSLGKSSSLTLTKGSYFDDQSKTTKTFVIGNSLMKNDKVIQDVALGFGFSVQITSADQNLKSKILASTNLRSLKKVIFQPAIHDIETAYSKNGLPKFELNDPGVDLVTLEFSAVE